MEWVDPAYLGPEKQESAARAQLLSWALLGASVPGLAIPPFLQQEVGWTMGAIIGGFLFVAGITRALWVRRVLRNIHCGTPEEVVRLFYRWVGRDSSVAAHALSRHPEGAQRGAGLRQIWNQWLAAGKTGYRIDSIVSSAAEPVGAGFCQVPVRLRIVQVRSQGGTIEMLEEVFEGEPEQVHELRKLMVQRDGRWRMVNGDPGDEADRNVAAEIRRQREIGSGGAGPSDSGTQVNR